MEKMFRIGLETMSWGPGFRDIASITSEAKDLGFSGIEIVQKPAFLDPKNLNRAFSKTEIEFLGLSGGNLEERWKLAQLLRENGYKTPKYFCVDEWSETVEHILSDSDYYIGLHPHRFKKMETVNQALDYIERDNTGKLKLIFDTAHQFLTNGFDENAYMDEVNLAAVSNQLLAIHLKDWRDDFGSSPLRFPDGFVSLGEGDLSESAILLETIDTFTSKGFSGWMVIEQDSAREDPITAASKSISYLKSIASTKKLNAWK